MERKYRVVGYLRIDPDPESEVLHDSYTDAALEKAQCEDQNPDDIFEIEIVEKGA